MENKYAALMERLGFERPKPEQSDLFLTEEALQTIESKLGHPLPADYREFLRDYPGIFFDAVHFPITSGDGMRDGDIWHFHGSTSKTDLADIYFDIIGVFEGEDENCGLEMYPGLRLLKDTINVGWPEELLPIGYGGGGGNLTCLALTGLRPGAIFYWRGNPWSDKQNVYLVADSFGEFMHLLRKK